MVTDYKVLSQNEYPRDSFSWVEFSLSSPISLSKLKELWKVLPEQIDDVSSWEGVETSLLIFEIVNSYEDTNKVGITTEQGIKIITDLLRMATS